MIGNCITDNLPWHSLPSDDVIKRLETNTTSGLSRTEVESRLKKHGHNQLEEKKGESPFMLILWHFETF